MNNKENEIQVPHNFEPGDTMKNVLAAQLASGAEEEHGGRTERVRGTQGLLEVPANATDGLHSSQ